MRAVSVCILGRGIRPALCIPIAPVTLLLIPSFFTGFCSQKAATRYLGWMLADLSDEGLEIASVTMKDPALFAIGSRTIWDITAPDGLASLTEVEMWQLVAHVPLSLRITLFDVASMMSLMRLSRLHAANGMYGACTTRNWFDCRRLRELRPIFIGATARSVR